MKTMFKTIILSASMMMVQTTAFADPRIVPDFKPDLGLIEKSGTELLQACQLHFKQRIQHKIKNKSEVEPRARDLCFCITKDIKRRLDIDEIRVAIASYKDQIEDDAELTEEQSFYLHSIDQAEVKCIGNSKYRFGKDETLNKKTRFPSSGAKNAPAKPLQNK